MFFQAALMPERSIETQPASALELYRRARGLTCAQLAELATIHRATVGRIERGEHVPRRATARLLAEVLEVEVEALFPPPGDGS